MALKQVRERRMLSQTELAELAGITRSQVNRIERGKAQPRMSTVRKLLKALDVLPNDLIIPD